MPKSERLDPDRHEFPRHEGPMTSIEATLNTDPLCQQIVSFLLLNETAMDTAKGIAAWWVQGEELAVQDALDRLTTCGVIVPYTFSSARLYGLTRIPEVRRWLRVMFSGLSKRSRV